MTPGIEPGVYDSALLSIPRKLSKPEVPERDRVGSHSQVKTDKAVATRIFSKDYADALAETKSLYAQMAVTDAQVTSARQNLRLSRMRFEGGEGSALEVVTAS